MRALLPLRPVLKSSFLIVFLASVLLVESIGFTAEARPNVLLIMADDNSQ